MRANGDPAVTGWLDRQRPDTLFLTTVTLAELLLGHAIGISKATAATSFASCAG